MKKKKDQVALDGIRAPKNDEKPGRLAFNCQLNPVTFLIRRKYFVEASNAIFFFFSSRRRHTSWPRAWSSDVCSSDLREARLARDEELALKAPTNDPVRMYLK